MNAGAPLLVAALAAGPGQFFDDFGHADLGALQAAGWAVRSEAGHPGIAGAAWGPGSVQLVDAPEGQRALRLAARTDGRPEGTQQAQLCQQRKFFRGTYAARVRFSDRPQQGADGDPVVQSFYAVAPLRFAFDPEFSEVDFEYLPNGGWGSPETRLYGISWQTVRIEPWLAYNQAQQRVASHDGWHLLVMHVGDAHTEHFVDGVSLARHGGRNVPVVPMAISFNLWFAPAGLRPPSAQPRAYTQDVDWVLHVQDRLLTPAQVAAQVSAWRAGGRAHLDTMPGPVLPAGCNF